MLDEKSFPSWWDEESLILSVLDYGFDEGGRGDTLLISLQIGNTASVRRLQRQWQSVLKRFGLGFFHSKDYDKEAGQGVFGSIGRAERRRLLGQLTRLVHKHLLFGLTANLDTAMYESETTARFRSDYGSAFSFAVQMALFAANRYLDLEARPINILIARGHRNLNQVLEQFEVIRQKTPALNIKTYSPGDMPEWGVLQAADMLAYSRCRELFDGDLEIYNALHSIRKGVYKPVTFDCNLDLIRTVRDLRSTEAAAYKAWGARTPKPGRVIL